VSTTTKAILVAAAITLLGGILRFVNLGQPERKYFDEVYYASDGCLYAGVDFRECDLDDDSERSWVHPPLGKALISLGIDPPGPAPGFGNTPFGWRVAAAAAGTATVGVVALLAFLLFGRVIWAGVAGLLLATESLHFVQSRISMLDVFLAFFVALGFLFLVADRHRNERSPGGFLPVGPTDPDQVPPPPDQTDLVLGGVRPLRLLAGASFGAAVAVKWSGVFGLLGAAGLSVAWSIAAAVRRRREPDVDRRAAGRAFVAEAAGQVLAFILVPAVVYVMAWIPWLADRGFDVTAWAGHHGDMWEYHRELDTVKENGEPIHPYMSRAWSWFLLARPVAYFWQGDPKCCSEILGIGHPFLFWGALLVIPYLLITWITRREWRAGAILVPVLAQYLPWLLVSRPLFLFYMTPVTPFLALGTTFVLRDVSRVPLPGRRTAAAVVAVVLLVSLGVFAFFWPVLAGDRIPYESWQRRMWVSDGDGLFNWV
jgi:dolichyl-phosphate-mannose--protein O-mannosyl transferase